MFGFMEVVLDAIVFVMNIELFAGLLVGYLVGIALTFRFITWLARRTWR